MFTLSIRIHTLLTPTMYTRQLIQYRTHTYTMYEFHSKMILNKCTLKGILGEKSLADNRICETSGVVAFVSAHLKQRTF